MQITRRSLFASIAAAFIAKPAIKGLPLALVRSFDRQLIRCEYPGCQYARGFLRRGGYEFYPDVFTIETKPLINPRNRLLAREEITSRSLQILEANTTVLPKIGDTLYVKRPR